MPIYISYYIIQFSIYKRVYIYIVWLNHYTTLFSKKKKLYYLYFIPILSIYKITKNYNFLQ